jgi:hypothetical protein
MTTTPLPYSCFIFVVESPYPFALQKEIPNLAPASPILRGGKL